MHFDLLGTSESAHRYYKVALNAHQLEATCTHILAGGTKSLGRQRLGQHRLSYGVEPRIGWGLPRRFGCSGGEPARTKVP
jgi:hypothetical protein